MTNSAVLEPLIDAPDGTGWIPGGEFVLGAVSRDNMAMMHEKPAHKVFVDGFYMDIHEVTNGQFPKFVGETLYVVVIGLARNEKATAPRYTQTP